MLNIKDLSFNYGDGRQIYEKFNFNIKQDEFVAVLGPSGCGKSTLVDLIAGYKKPKTGQIVVNGIAIEKPGRDRIIISQDNDLFEWMTIYKNMKLVVEDDDVIDRYLKLTKLDSYKDLFIGELSGGMKKRLSLARAMAVHPKFIIMDEPFVSLDPQIKENIEEEISNIITKNHMTVFLVTHDMEEAIFLSNKVYIFNKNKPVAIEKQVEIPFPFPRKILIKDTIEFVNLKKQIKDFFAI